MNKLSKLSEPSQKVYVVSWVSSTNGEQSTGGFDWYMAKEDAEERFDQEIEGWEGYESKIRLVEVEIPTYLQSEVLTEFLDNEIEWLEEEATALREVDSTL